MPLESGDYIDGVTEQGPERHGDEVSPLELEFVRRWRPMVDRVGGDGGQKRAAKHLNWTTSTVSRDYKGDTLPTDERLFQLASALQLPRVELLDLASLLSRARAARLDRRRTSRAGGADPAAAPGPVTAADGSPSGNAPARLRGRWRGRRGLAVVLSVVAVAAAVAVGFGLRSAAGGKPAAHGPSAAGVVGSFPGAAMEAVRIPVGSLTPGLAAQFRQGRTAHASAVTGFVFRNHAAAGLCLTAPDTGSAAGRNRDPIVVSGCRGTPNQVWIPLQWEVMGYQFTHLVSERYQSMCLNANNMGGMSNGHLVELWDCYPAGNEAWDFGDWHDAVRAGTRSYPMFARSGRLCLDANKRNLRDGSSVLIWSQYRSANQFWS